MTKNRPCLFRRILQWHVVIAGIAVGGALTVTRPTLSAEDAAAQAAPPAYPELDFGRLNSQIQAAIQRAKPACVAVGLRRGRTTRGSFSAVIVSQDGHVLTAGHCVRPGSTYEVFLADGRKLRAQALGRSTYLDCGLIKIEDPTDLPWVEMGQSSDLIRNQPCLSISHPGGHDSQRGSVVRFGRVVDIHAKGHIHNTCLMEPGDSGGGLFDLEGRVIGIHSYIQKSLSDNFDIPVDAFHDHWEELSKASEFNPPHAAPMFGIDLQSSRATDEGAEVEGVMDASPAAEAGLQPGDWITSVDRTKVKEGFRIGRELRRRTTRGRDLTLEIRRDDETSKIVIKRHRPATPSIEEDPSAGYDAMANLAGGFAEMEGMLDDCTVRITSTINDQERSLLGTVFSRDGLIVSKSSRVGESPTVVDHALQTLPARVVGRDQDNDLVLLQVDGQFETTVDSGSPADRLEGEILLSPRLGEADGLVSVVGSREFASTKQKRFGFLGVLPEMRDAQVVLRRVDDGRPAKQAGLKPDDVVLKIDEKPITTVAELINTIGANPPGQVVQVVVEREDAEQVFDVTLASKPRNSRRHIADAFAGGSSLRHTGFEAVFCHDAHAEPQECGGPVFDAEGNFVGLNIARFSRTQCYALPADLVRQSVLQIQARENEKKEKRGTGDE